MAALYPPLQVSANVVLLSSVLSLSCVGLSSAGGSHGGHGHGGPAAVSHAGHPSAGHPNGITYNPGIFFGYGAAGSYLYSPPLVVVGPGGFAPFLGPAFPQGIAPFANGGGMGGGLNLPMPPPGLIDPAAPALRPRRSNPARSKELTEIGDRSFRGHNTSGPRRSTTSPSRPIPPRRPHMSTWPRCRSPGGITRPRPTISGMP